MECDVIERYEDGNPIYKKKKAYDNQDAAIAVAKIVNSKDHVIHKVVPYRCKYCNKYHLGRNGKLLTDKERLKHKKQLR